jgi:hypothetical protein
VQHDTGSPWAMFLGAVLDGLPESFVLGITLALGGSIDVASLPLSLFSNIPQGVVGMISSAKSRDTPQAETEVHCADEREPSDTEGKLMPMESRQRVGAEAAGVDGSSPSESFAGGPHSGGE